MYLGIAIATVVLATLLISSGLYLFGLYSRTTEKEHGLMAAELVRTGNKIIIDHGMNLFSRYLQLAIFFV